MIKFHFPPQWHTRPSKFLTCLALLVAFFLMACSSIDCPMNNTIGCKYALRGNDGTFSDTLSVITLRPDSNDAVIQNRITRVTTFSLPMSYEHERDTLLFVLTDTLGKTSIDTTVISKTNTPHFESVDCPARFFHTIKEIKTTHHRIDSIVIANPNVDNEEKENLLIYFHPAR